MRRFKPMGAEQLDRLRRESEQWQAAERERVLRLNAGHARGLHGQHGANAPAFGTCDGCWRERLATHQGRTYDLRTIAGRLERDLDAIERRMAAEPGKSWQWLDTHRDLRTRLEAERRYAAPPVVERDEAEMEAER
jgi:hypothetical protein